MIAATKEVPGSNSWNRLISVSFKSDSAHCSKTMLVMNYYKFITFLQFKTTLVLFSVSCNNVSADITKQCLA